jgi:hypothetical protein
MTEHEGPSWHSGTPRYPLPDVAAVAADLEEQGAPLREFGLDAEAIAKIGGGVPDDKLWPLVRAAYDTELFERIPENGIPPLSYNLSDDSPTMASFKSGRCRGARANALTRRNRFFCGEKRPTKPSANSLS